MGKASHTELPAIALAGPTASGKTAAAMALSHEFDLEIISVDSALVYRGMDIGTAKPAAAERAAVPHHLIDILDPTQSYSAAAFVADAQRLIGEIRGRGRLPLLVGGTMLYFKALMDGLDDMPKSDPIVRAALEAEAFDKGWPAMHAELAVVDPVTAARLPPNDSQRIQRALEVQRITGRPMSSFFTSGLIAKKGHSALELPIISLEPVDRAWLHGRIATRFDDMLAAGFLGEVERLRARGDLSPALSSIRCVGYRQAWEIMDRFRTAPASSPFPMAQLRELGIVATRQLAKRQLTWLRSMPQRQVVACDDPAAVQTVLAQVRTLVTGRVR